MNGLDGALLDGLSHGFLALLGQQLLGLLRRQQLQELAAHYRHHLLQFTLGVGVLHLQDHGHLSHAITAFIGQVHRAKGGRGEGGVPGPDVAPDAHGRRHDRARREDLGPRRQGFT